MLCCALLCCAVLSFALLCLTPLSACGQATLVWGTILYLFEQHRAHVHGSLRGSMSFLYHDANTWTSAADFLPSAATVAVLLYAAFVQRS